MATLTGAQGLATGKLHAAVLTNSEEWENRACKAGRASGDLVHPLPFCPDLHFSDLNSPIADMRNSTFNKMQVKNFHCIMDELEINLQIISGESI